MESHSPTSTTPGAAESPSAAGVSQITAISGFIGKHGFATFVAVALLLWHFFTDSERVSGAELKTLQHTVSAHAAEMTTRINETKLWNDRMLRFAYYDCLRGTQTQSDRDACEAVIK